MRDAVRLRWLRAAAMTLAQAGVLLLLALALDDFRLSGLVDAVVAVVVISLVIGFIWPYAYRLADRFHPVGFPLVLFAIIGLVTDLTAAVLPGVSIRSLAAALLIPAAAEAQV